MLPFQRNSRRENEPSLALATLPVYVIVILIVLLVFQNSWDLQLFAV